MSLHSLNNCNKELSESTFTTGFRNINVEIHLKNVKNIVGLFFHVFLDFSPVDKKMTKSFSFSYILEKEH